MKINTYLGKIISQQGINLDPRKVQVFLDMPY